ncbi:Na+/citrate or Na+/malate symporter [Pseudarthrobacter sp. W1I19]|uniref:2-hydroxycarboxylate transporter family protein n=1 Tax=Pseudarthrobacter sp. W1I19 TaxID=3042288 RepID=UPI0027891787|nr:2-hydroxycarboxylate transporter family protein [Pseudarthrobacter sp. W1I19]MDQ0923905.1 Na+/citrate or Na+/malate symporter [Pseudarthrobacter sp. W1I19]
MSTNPGTTETTNEPTDDAMSEISPGPAGGIGHPVTETVGARPGTHYPGRLGFKIASVPAPLYLTLAGLVLAAAITGNLPDTMVVGFAATILLGGLFIWIGNLFPVVRDFGLPTVLCTFAPATLAFFGLMPENLVTVVQNFTDGHGFLDFFVVGIIAGAILGMPRALLLKAGPRFAVPIIGCLIATFVLVGLLASVTGFGFIEGILFIAAPIMAGGLGVGALPMSEMYAAKTGGDSAAFMGDLMSAVVMANVVCILIAGIYNGLGKRKKQLFVGFNGHGQLLRIKGRSDELTVPPKRDTSSFIALGKGLLIAGSLFVFGELIAALLPAACTPTPGPSSRPLSSKSSGCSPRT